MTVPTPMKRVNLWTDGEADESIVRLASVALASYAVAGNAGRMQGDPIFEAVTEGRQRWWISNGKRRDYSSCGDLIHWTFFRLMGCRPYNTSPLIDTLKPWINRTEAYGWKVGWNISKLRYKTGDAWRSFKKGQFDPSPGDMLLIGEHGAEHVCIVKTRGPSAFSSCDYGQFFAQHGKHGGKEVSRVFGKGRDGRIWCGGSTLSRPCIGVVDVWKLYQQMANAGPLDPALVPDDFDAGSPSDNPYL